MILRELMARRVPHIVGVYLAAGWAVLEFTDWLVNRYVLSPHLTDLALAGWALMLPSVLLLAWFHGAPGRDEWTRVEKVGVPLNLVLAAVVLFVGFSGKDLGAATTEVTVEDESGETVARTIPKGEFRKHLALFYFENASGDTALDWLQYGVPLGIQDDLVQDMFIDVRTSWPYFNERLEQAGYPDGVDLPLGLQREIAEDLHLDRLVTGQVAGDADSLVVTVSLYDVGSGKRLEERRFTGSDVFALIDRASVQLKRDLEIPEQHIESQPDLPFRETATTSLAAYRDYVRGYRALERESWEEAAAGFAAAIEHDPTYALANLMLYVARLFVNDVEGASSALEGAMEHAYKLPERYQYQMRAAFYRFVRQDFEKARAVAGMHAELFPDDLAAHNVLLVLNQQEGEWEKAIANAKRILDLDPNQYDMYRRIGDLYTQIGRLEEAARYFERYAERFPQDPRALTALARVSRLRGLHEQARDQYERALLLDEDNVPAMIALARIESELGQDDAAEAQFAEAMEAAATPNQRWWVLEARYRFRERRGSLALALQDLERGWEELERGQPPLVAVQYKLRDLGTVVKAGEPERARRYLDELAGQLQPPFDLLLSIGEFAIAEELEDPEALEASLEAMDSLIVTMGVGSLRPVYLNGRGRVLELRGDCEAAIEAYKAARELLPPGATVNRHLGRCQRKLGRYDQAIASLSKVLEIDPTEPNAHNEIAKVYLAKGNSARAREHLDTALGVWEDADPNFEPAREARADRAALGG